VGEARRDEGLGLDAGAERLRGAPRGAPEEAAAARSGHASELRARVLAGAAIGVIRATMRHWFTTDGREDLARLGDEALDCLDRGFSLG
jgi:hypothetical protein